MGSRSTWKWGVAVVVLAAVAAPARSADAGPACTLPADFRIALEQTGILGSGVVAPAQPSAASPLVEGDGLRQANGQRVDSCADVERAAAEAYAKGMPLLLAVSRGGALVPLLVEARAETAPVVAPVAAPPAVAGSGHQPGASAEAAVPARAVEASEVPTSARALVESSATVRSTEGEAEAQDQAATTVATTAPLGPRPPIVLPPSSDSAPEARTAAASAVAQLRDLEEVARSTVPLAVYEGRLRRAEKSIAALPFGSGDAGDAARRGAAEVLATHDTAAAIRQAKMEYLLDSRKEMRTVTIASMPYFSDSDVPRWVAEYPFLETAVLEPPRPRRIILKGEAPGRFSPDDACDLLWRHAHEQTVRLAAWAGAD